MGYIWLFAVLFFILLLLWFPLRVRVEYGYSKNAGKQQLTVFLNGFKLFKSDFEKMSEKETAKNKESSKKPNVKKENKDDYTSFMDKLSYFKAVYNHLKGDIIKILQYLKNRCQIPKFVIHLDIGFEDAAKTGMAAGVAYSAVYGVAALIYNHLNLKKRNMDVYATPHFQKECMDFYFDGIFQLRVAHIIVVLIKLLGVYKKFKKIKPIKTKEGGAKK